MQWLAEVGAASQSVVVTSHRTQTILAATLFFLFLFYFYGDGLLYRYTFLAMVPILVYK